MCLGGSAAPTWQPPQRQEPEPGPDSPNDKVNNMDVDNKNERNYGIPDRPDKEYSGWQRDVTSEGYEGQYSKGWRNKDGTYWRKSSSGDGVEQWDPSGTKNYGGTQSGRSDKAY
tara:strand:+ start:325 stop:666 length:342 start_codon:yes stop_codon:yes gene_type:complete